MRGCAKDHGRCIGIVATEGVNHRVGERDCERAVGGGREIEVGPVKEHAGMSDAVTAKVAVRQRRLADL